MFSDIINGSSDGIAKDYVDDFHSAMAETLHLDISDKEEVAKNPVDEANEEKVDAEIEKTTEK